MESLISFRLQIYKYTLITALILAAGALFVLGPGARYVQYAYGLALGTCVSVMSFNILFLVSRKALAMGKKWMAPLGYMARLPIYGFALYVCLRTGITAAIACIIGFFTITLSIIYVHGIKAKYSVGRKVRPEVMEEFEREDRERDIYSWDREKMD